MPMPVPVPGESMSQLTLPANANAMPIQSVCVLSICRFAAQMERAD